MDKVKKYLTAARRLAELSGGWRKALIPCPIALMPFPKTLYPKMGQGRLN
jgi:hypothetical protein